ncbi:MAG: TraB/GumN family protein [Desulfovibrionaceae bacterium]
MKLPPLPADILLRAQVPEHSVALMQAVSQGHAFVEGDYFFVADADWLMAIAYPLRAAPVSETTSQAAPEAARYTHEGFSAALQAALARTGATDCWAIGPDLPPPLQGQITERDEYYILPTHAGVPPALHRPLAKAASLLRVEHSQTFSAAHRRLWAEFLERTALQAAVRELFARTPYLLAGTNSPLWLLNAWDAQGHLAACLLMDYSAAAFSAYIIGAHSKIHYTAHATDVLFAAMLEESRRRGQDFVHLGLGVHAGIVRFKRKWGGVPTLPYVLAAWQEKPAQAKDIDSRTLFKTLWLTSASDQHHDVVLENQPLQQPFAMLWEVEKNGKISWLAGTAHFFCYSFEQAFRRLFKKVHTVVFEGPLDPQTLAVVDAAGKNPDKHQSPLIDRLTEKELCQLERVVRGPEGFWPRFLNMEAEHKVDVRWYLRHARPWCAMFSLWTGFLACQGWEQSVDLEAWNLGQSLGKTVIGMESIDEQLSTLDAVPVDRVLSHFRHCRQWGQQVRANVNAYLAGDLAAMMGTSTEFPTRTALIIGARDQRFRERMTPFLEAGDCVVFVGAAHLLNLRTMLREDGFSLRRCLPTWGHRLRAHWKPYVYE